MSIENLIESVGLTPAEMKRYLLAEIDEFLEASDPHDMEEEFGDILFALMTMAWAHSGQHYGLRRDGFEQKVRRRLRTCATLSRHPPVFMDDRIPQLKLGVLHMAFGQFAGQWASFDALKNGTVAEIQLLTDAPFERTDIRANHCIITFGNTEAMVFDILGASADMEGGNTIRCQIPDFMFTRAKRELKFNGYSELIAHQVLAALDCMQIAPGAVMHFHSWETGFLLDSEEFRSYLNPFKTIFSPYLTTARLKTLVEGSNEDGWTMSNEEITVSSHYERRLCEACMRVVVEGARDREFYSRWVHPDRLDVLSFAHDREASFETAPRDDTHLHFIAGGRPVREKGFVELCREFAQVRDWAQSRGLTVSLSILCREARRDKGASYIGQMEAVITQHDLANVISIEPKVSLEALKRRIAQSAAIIAPSLYDPFCLMPTYAVEVRKPAFVSSHAGVSENIKSRQFTFDPTVCGDLSRAISRWFDERPDFEFESCFPSYHNIYLSKEAPRPWA